MILAHREQPGRSFSLAVLAWVLSTFAVIGGLLVFFVLWSASEIDAGGLDRQSVRVAHAIAGQLEILPHDQQSVTIWADALRAVERSDLGWLESNIGSWMFEYFGHDISVVLNAGDSAVYASSDGRSGGSDIYANISQEITPIVAEVRRIASRGYVDQPPYVSDFVSFQGKPALVSVMPIISDESALSVPPGAEPLLVSLVWLDRTFELGLIDRFLVEAGRFTTTPAGPDLASLPVTNRAGRIVGFFEWQPYRPGTELLTTTMPALVSFLCVIALLLAALLYRLWRASSALESKRLDAERSASLDVLTGLPNRANFDRRLDEHIEQAADTAPFALLMLDLDRFKQVNDTLGHQAGDDLIRQLAARLRTLLHADEIIARLGGDEFGVLALRDAEDAYLLGTAIIEATARPFRLNQSEAFVGVSIGIVLATPDVRDRPELTRRADIALYEAKAAGRNRVAFYQERMNEQVQTRHHIEAELREALRVGDQLWVAFQPLFARETGTFAGAEALVRWRHPHRGAIPPSDFVAIAESSGLIEPLGDFVLTRACELGARWPGHKIAVNISPAQLRNPGFPASLFALLGRTGMQAQNLELEITESILLDDEHVATIAIRAFREAGIKIALDDFGTGFSSLNYLTRYPVDRIKIDRSFIHQLTTSSGANAIVQAMVTLAHALGIEVTAEGVETVDQHRLLALMGCNSFQGYLLSPPLTAQRLEQLFGGAATPVPEVA